jgi:hypothetical protein
MGKVPDVSRALEALQAVHDVIDIGDMIKAIRRIGNRNTSVAAQKRAIAMMSEGRYEDDELMMVRVMVVINRNALVQWWPLRSPRLEDVIFTMRAGVSSAADVGLTT